jgi:hypothetical protein
MIHQIPVSIHFVKKILSVRIHITVNPWIQLAAYMYGKNYQFPLQQSRCQCILHTCWLRRACTAPLTWCRINDDLILKGRYKYAWTFINLIICTFLNNAWLHAALHLMISPVILMIDLVSQSIMFLATATVHFIKSSSDASENVSHELIQLLLKCPKIKSWSVIN